MENLTEKARKRHLRTGGHRCPYCKASDVHLDYGELSPVESGNIEQKISCDKCRRCWVDIFHLVDIRELGV
jgi:uncharacterized protein with PIN domain